MTKRLALAAVCALAALVYLNSLENDFALDDTSIVLENENVHGVGQLWDAVSRPYWDLEPARIGLYRPLTTATYAIGWDLWDGDAAGFHAVNILLHVAVTGLVFGLVLALYPSVLAAGLAGAVFAVHPVHVEAVANIVGRAELLAALLYMVACLAYLRLRPGWRSALLVTAAYFLALCAKEIAVTLPGALVLLELVRPRSEEPPPGRHGAAASEFTVALRRAIARWRLFLAMIAAFAAYMLARFSVMGALLGSAVAPWYWGLPDSARLLTAIRVWPEYLRLMLFPLSLSSDYGPAVVVPETSLFAPLVLLGALVGLGLLGLAVAAWRRARLISLGILWFALTVLPVSNVLFSTGIILAERTLYLPSIGLALALAGVIRLFRQDRPAWVPALSAVLLLAAAAGAVRTWLRNPSWRDSESVLLTLVREHPGSYRSQWTLAQRLVGTDRDAEGMARYRTAVAMVPGYYSLRFEYAMKLYLRHHYGIAAQHFDIARRTIPEREEAHVFYLTALLQDGRPADALDAAPEILRRFPDSGGAHNQVARALARLGRFDEAARQRRRAIRLTSGTPAWQQWGHLATIELARDDSAAATAALDSAAAAVAAADDTAAAVTLPSLQQLRDALTRRDTAALPFW